MFEPQVQDARRDYGVLRNNVALLRMLEHAYALLVFVNERYEADCGNEDVKDQHIPNAVTSLQKAIEEF